MFPFLNFLGPSSRAWFEFILDMTVKSIFILGVAFIVLLIGKRVSFITRHLVLNLAIVSILLIPLFSYILPKWEISILPTMLLQETTNVSFEGTEKLEPHTQNLKQEVIPDSHSSRNINNGRAKNDTHWPAWLFVLWLVGATGVFTWTIAGIIGTRTIVKKACPVKDSTLKTLASSSAKKMGIKRKVRLLQSQKTVVPLTCGWLHPIIVLPEETESWPMKRKEIVLLHELAHIKRADFLLNLITLSASIIYWFNPLVWIALRQLNIERERASDDHVLALGTKCSEYALHLVEIAKRLSSMKWLSPTRITMAKKSNLEVRIMSILSNKKPSIRIKPLTLVFIGFLAISLVMPISSLHTWAQEKEKPKEALPIKEAVKKALKEFYRLIESMDFSHAMKFLAKLPDLPVFEKYPFVILEKEKDSRTWAILSVKDWKDLDVDSVIKSIEEQPDYFFVTESLTIKGTDKHGKTHILVNNPEHTLILFRKDGKWKITFEGLKTKAIDISKIIKETDEEKGSKKIGIAFTSEGINYIIMESKPLLKVGKPYIIKKFKKGTEIKVKDSEIGIDVIPHLKKGSKIEVAVIPHITLDKCHAVKVNVSPLIIFGGKPALKIDENFVLVLDKEHALKLKIKPLLIKIRKEILEKIKEKKKKEKKQDLTVQNA